MIRRPPRSTLFPYTRSSDLEVIRLLGADCTVPVGAYSEINGEKISLTVSDGNGHFAQGEKEIEKRFELVKELTDKL